MSPIKEKEIRDYPVDHGFGCCLEQRTSNLFT
jgi:hypothetical protein